MFSYSVSSFLPCSVLPLWQLSRNAALKQALKNEKAPGTSLELEVKGRMGGQCYACSWYYFLVCKSRYLLDAVELELFPVSS